MLTGHVLYRLQYSDELREPQAEMVFEELVEFLLERGAVPDAKGVGMLRVAELWTPAGTGLLVGPGGGACLRVGVSDEGDGVLSLMVEWRREWDKGRGEGLGQGWVRVRDFVAKEVEGEGERREEREVGEEQREGGGEGGWR